jgi:fructokinase
MNELFGGVEAGGTKFVCILGSGPRDVLAEKRFATSSPQDTLAEVTAFFKPFCESGRVRAIGVGSFGPLDLETSSRTYGCITSTPKPGWQNVDLVGTLVTALQVPVTLDTDVNAAALGEYMWGAAAGTSSCLYLTVGTGIGGGFVVDGHPLHGLQHPEMGHIRVAHDRDRDPFAGACPYHGDCLEGLASGPAIQKRFGMRGEEMIDSDPFWDLEAEYLGAAIASYVLVLSPCRIVVGGGIMQRSFLLPRIRAHVQQQIADYIRQPALIDGLEQYLVSPGLGSRSGVLGALALAASLSAADGGELRV